MKIKDYVMKIVKHGTTNPFEIAKRKDIIVLFEDLGNTLGFTTLINALNSFILIIKLTKLLNDLFVHMN